MQAALHLYDILHACMSALYLPPGAGEGAPAPALMSGPLPPVVLLGFSKGAVVLNQASPAGGAGQPPQRAGLAGGTIMAPWHHEAHAMRAHCACHDAMTP